MKARCGDALYWHNCYTGTYDLITPESRAHPAKMAPTLGFRILEHLEGLGLLNNGDTILDPMGGTGLTNICAGAKGYRSISVELEAAFVEYQHENKKYAERRLFKALDWQIVKGDSRELSLLLLEKGLVSVTSPPYVDGVHKVTGLNRDKFKNPARVGNLKYSQVSTKGYGKTEGQIGNLKDPQLKVITSPPYGEAVNTWKGAIDWEKAGRPDRLPENEPAPSVQGTREWRYSEDASNIGNLPDRPLKAITSPPYGDVEKRDRSIESSNERERLYPRGDRNISAGYQASTANNIGSLPDRPLKSIMSPPYAEAVHSGTGIHLDKFKDPSRVGKNTQATSKGYGNTQGQIGRKGEQENGRSYLSAMLKVYQEIAAVSDVLAVIIKNPTRNKQLRRLDLDTIKLLELAGWTIHCQHRALLFEELEGRTLFGETVTMVKGRMSFFKRLSWQQGQPVAAWEDILIATKGKG